MHQFVSGSKLTKSIQELLNEQAPARLAVAFWGRKAASLLKLPSSLKHITIICDLRSGACNPDELNDLLSRGAQIWAKDGLHAKVYLSNKKAVITSANASANGLGEEGDAIDWALEVGISTNDAKVVSDAETWFESQIADAEKVDKELIEACRPIWKKKFNDPPARGKSLFEVFDRNPARFVNRAIRIVAYEYLKPTKEEIDAFKAQGPRIFGASFKKYNMATDVPFYVDRNSKMKIAPGDWFLDFLVTGKAKRKVVFHGVWQVQPDVNSWQFKLKNKGRLIFLHKRTDLSGMSITKDDKKRLTAAIEGYLNRAKRSPNPSGDLVDIPLSDFKKLEL